MIRIANTATLAKTFSVKREKTGEDTESVVAHLKIADCLVDRDQLDEIIGLPIGWSTGALFDDLGAPLSRLTLGVARRELLLSGVIKGGEKSTDPQLRLKDAEIDGIMLELTKLGALLSCQLSWTAEGDEVDDIADMLGAICVVDAVVSDGGQKDLLRVEVTDRALQAAADRDDTPEPDAPPAEHMEAPRLSSAAEVIKKLQDGFHLRGADPDYWVERPDGSERQGVWLNAARACLKRGLEPIGDEDKGDTVGRWQWKEAA